MEKKDILKSKKMLFVNSFQENIHREGADKLLAWLQTTDFFVAPASTRFHLAEEGGLLTHSLNVYDRLQELCRLEEEIRNEFQMPSAETIAICALLHDICKVNFYTTEMRNAKNEKGEWVKVPYYKVADQLPYGHGEKSVYMISGFMQLAREEAIAIRWHMGGFDDSARSGSHTLSEAYKKYPLAVLLHIADLQATYLDEVESR